MILLKLGGSIITDKKKRFSARRAAISKIVKVLDIDEPLVIVHGGGSYGHHVSVEYDMHTAAKKYDTRGVAKVKRTMIDLNTIILDKMLEHKLDPYVVPPGNFMLGDKPISAKVSEIGDIAKSMIPITYGDAIWHGNKRSYILSGDKIMIILAKALRPRLCIFTLDQDGLYKDMDTKELIPEVDSHKPKIKASSMDVTGGMTRKVKSAKEIAKNGVDVFFVNGFKPSRILQAINHDKFKGTIFRGKT